LVVYKRETLKNSTWTTNNYDSIIFANTSAKEQYYFGVGVTTDSLHKVVLFGCRNLNI